MARYRMFRVMALQDGAPKPRFFKVSATDEFDARREFFRVTGFLKAPKAMGWAVLAVKPL